MRYWVALFFIVLGVVFGLQNPAVVELHWFDWSVKLPVAVLCLVMLLIGLLVGWMLYPLQQLFRNKS